MFFININYPLSPSPRDRIFNENALHQPTICPCDIILRENVLRQHKSAFSTCDGIINENDFHQHKLLAPTLSAHHIILTWNAFHQHKISTPTLSLCDRILSENVFNNKNYCNTSAYCVW